MSFWPSDEKRESMVARPVSLDDQVAAYTTNPWAPAPYAPYLDFQPAPGPHSLEQRGDYEWGNLAVLGFGPNPPSIGELVLGAGADGEPTLAIRVAGTRASF